MITKFSICFLTAIKSLLNRFRVRIRVTVGHAKRWACSLVVVIKTSLSGATEDCSIPGPAAENALSPKVRVTNWRYETSFGTHIVNSWRGPLLWRQSILGWWPRNGTVFRRTWKTLTYRTMNSGGR